jgi:hypothetical protein
MINSNRLERSEQTHSPQNAALAAPRLFPRITVAFLVSEGENRRVRFLISGSLVLVFCTIVLWGISLSSINVRNITDYGLVSVLPSSFFVAVGLLTISFCLVVRWRQTPVPVLLLHSIVLILIIHGTLAMVYDAPRYSWVYKHIGVAGYIQRNGSVDPSIDAYHNWPGFFALSAFFNDVAGFESSLDYAAWAQLFFNLLYLGPLLLILKSCTSDRRLIWLSLWFFYLTNWVGQDYFAPQAMSYFFYLVILGVCLTWFKVTTPFSESAIGRWLGFAPLVSLFHKVVSRATLGDEPNIVPHTIQRVGVMAVVILGFAAIVSGHQLTPFVTIASVTALVIFQRCSARSLPLLMSIMTMAWFIYMAMTYLDGHILLDFQQVGQLSSNLNASAIERFYGSSGHVFVLYMRSGLTIGLWGLALLGGIRRLHQGYWDLSCALLAVAAFPMLAAQSYSGEMLLRVFLFSLPGMVFFAAALPYPSPESGASRRTTIITILMSSALLIGLFFAYFGDEGVNHFTQDELDAAQYLYHNAPHDSLVLTVTYNFPSRFTADYDQYDYFTLAGLPPFTEKSPDKQSQFMDRNVGVSDLEEIVNLVIGQRYSAAYLVVSQSQKEHAATMGLVPAGWIDNLEKALEQSEHFRLIFSNADARIYALVDAGSENKK